MRGNRLLVTRKALRLLRVEFLKWGTELNHEPEKRMVLFQPDWLTFEGQRMMDWHTRCWHDSRNSASPFDSKALRWEGVSATLSVFECQKVSFVIISIFTILSLSSALDSFAIASEWLDKKPARIVAGEKSSCIRVFPSSLRMKCYVSIVYGEGGEGGWEKITHGKGKNRRLQINTYTLL